MSYWQWAALTGLAIFMAFVLVAGLSQRNRAHYDPVSRLLDVGANIHETLNWNLVGSKAVRQHFQGRVLTNA